MTRSKMWGVSIVALGALLLCSLPLVAADKSPQPIIKHATAFGAGRVTFQQTPEQWGFHLVNPPHLVPKPHMGRVLDPVEQRPGPGPETGEFNAIYNVLGVGTGFPNYGVGVAPPDTTLAVGATEVVQWVNLSYADFNKSNGAIIPLNGQDSTPGNTIWQTLMPGTICADNNDGDIIVRYDRSAQRWLMAQNVFSGTYAVCVAISQTSTFSDNLWYAYQFPVVNSGFPDYPKWGVWPVTGASNGYFQTWNNFGPGGSGFVGPVICGYDRNKMLVGDTTAEQICFQLDETEDSLLPADLDSPILPPGSEDEFFIGSVGDVDNQHLSVYSMHINDWETGSASMTGLNNSQLVSIAPFTPACGGEYDGDCVPQEGTTDELESLGGRLLYRFAYWEDQPPANATATPPLPAPEQHWFVNFDVEASTGSNAVRWMEFIANLSTVPVTDLTIFQQGTYAGTTGDTNWRWFGSIARDNVRDILVGYSESNTNMYPSLAVAGRVFTDPLGTLSPEVLFVSGSGSQTDTADRWGDYSTMQVDPGDNCTFFFTTEYYTTISTFNWSTNISSWKFPNCH